MAIRVEIGATVNIKDHNSEFYCKYGEVIGFDKNKILVMFLAKEKTSGTGCIVERFNRNQVYIMTSRKKLMPIRGL